MGSTAARDGDAGNTDASDVPVDEDDERLHQPEDEATEHALRLMHEALRQSGAGRRWLVSENP